MTVWAILMGTVASSVFVSTGPPPAVQTHRHWRLKGTTAGTFDGGALAEIEFYDAVGGASIATGGTPSAGSEAFGGLATNAFDGLTEGAGGMWAGASGAIAAGTSWVAYDFGTPVTVAEFGIMPRSGGNADQMWDEWDLEYSDDGIAWLTHSSYSDFTAWTADVIRRFEITAPTFPWHLSHYSTGVDNTTTIPVTFPEAGVYAVMISGASGGVGSADSPITVTNVGGNPFIQHGFQESQNYAEVTGISVEVAVAGTFDITYTYSVSSYRRAADVWRLAPGVDLAETVWHGTTYNVSSTMSLDLKVGDQIVASTTSRGGTVTLSGIADNDTLNSVMEGTDIVSAYSELVTSDDSSRIVTLTGAGTEAARYVAGAMVFKGPPTPYPEILTPFITARYWKLDNFVYVGGVPTVNGLSLCTVNNVGSVYHEPTSINTNIGLNTNLDRNRNLNGDGTFNNTMASINAVLFEYPVAVAPSHLAIYGSEWDTDYIRSCDISFSLDGVDWFDCGRYDIDDPATHYTRIGFSDNHEVYFPVIGSPSTKLSVSEASTKVVIGQAGSGVSVQRARILLPLGRNNEALTVHDARLWVITTPA